MTFVIGLLVLGVLVFFHEAGHFLAAKIFGVKVESFSVGMGPVLFHKTFFGTDFRLSLFPLGGYCGMKGEKEFSKAAEENLSHMEAAPDSLYGTHPLKRPAIGFAGPFANLAFAFLAYAAISFLGYSYYSFASKIEIPSDENFPSPARDAGMKTGDEITKICGKKISDFSEIFEEVSARPEEEIEIEVLRNGERLVFFVKTILDKERGCGVLGVKSTGRAQKKEVLPLPFFKALGQGFFQTGKTVALTFKSIGVLFKGVDVTKAVSGPVRISGMLGSAAREGFSAGVRAGVVALCEFSALISISLFIMNLLPIPVLDGGLIFFALIAAISKKEIPPKIQYKIQIAGIVFVAAIFFIALFSDAKYFLEKRG